ncbi:DUF4259 domain-containing protein [Nonomuraea sp. NN258]|uniref:DUF4259 domain-containing protein n=1 Tax=Nonomuraea antri TaxID=2730852 RepID=UPI001569ECAE|nr:DUF4259 domain-containing protein [Nonomuraea antri]NRQ35432.1 DUF4259 domain-containing protein [Nonomuraea antri]
MGTWGKGPFDDDTAMDFFDELADCDATTARSAAVDSMRPCAPDTRKIAALTRSAHVSAVLLAGLRPVPEDPQRVVAPLPPGMLVELAADAAVAVERGLRPREWCTSLTWSTGVAS